MRKVPLSRTFVQAAVREVAARTVFLRAVRDHFVITATALRGQSPLASRAPALTNGSFEREDRLSGSVDTDINCVSSEGTKVAEIAAQHLPAGLGGGDDESVDGGALLRLSPE